MLKSRDAFAALTAVFLLLAAQNASRPAPISALICAVIAVTCGALWWGHAKRDQRIGR